MARDNIFAISSHLIKMVALSQKLPKMLSGFYDSRTWCVPSLMWVSSSFLSQCLSWFSFLISSLLRVAVMMMMLRILQPFRYPPYAKCGKFHWHWHWHWVGAERQRHCQPSIPNHLPILPIPLILSPISHQNSLFMLTRHFAVNILSFFCGCRFEFGLSLIHILCAERVLMLVNIFIEFMSLTDATLFANIVAILPKSRLLKLFPFLYLFSCR